MIAPSRSARRWLALAALLVALGLTLAWIEARGSAREQNRGGAQRVAEMRREPSSRKATSTSESDLPPGVI